MRNKYLPEAAKGEHRTLKAEPFRCFAV